MQLPNKDALERAKLAMDLIAPFLLILGVVVALMNLDRVKAALGVQDARVESAEILGVHMTFVPKSVLETTQTALEDTNNQRVKLIGLIGCLRRSNCAPADEAEIQKIIADPSVSQQVGRALQESRQAIGASDQLALAVAAVDPATAARTAAGQTDWAAVISADTKADEAAFELTRARRAYPDRPVEIIHRGSWLRTVIHFASEADARNAVPDIQRLTGRTPYVRALSDWCPGQTKGADGLRVC